MRRTFPIPVAATVSLGGCGGFDFSGTWSLDRVVAGYVDDPGSEQVQEYPVVYTQYTLEVALEVAPEGTLTFTTRTIYAYGAPDDLYTEGPYDWEKVDKESIEVTGDLDADVFRCDANLPAAGALQCVLDFNDPDEGTFRLTQEFTR